MTVLGGSPAQPAFSVGSGYRQPDWIRGLFGPHNLSTVRDPSLTEFDACIASCSSNEEMTRVCPDFG